MRIRYLTLALALHVALAAFLIVNLDRGVLVLPDAPPPEPIEATVVDQAEVEAEIERLRQIDRAREQELERQRQESERLAAERAAEQQRLQELKQQREREAREAEVERQRRAEAERQRQAEAERQRQAEAERRRQQEAEAERQRQEAERRRQEEAERQRREQQQAAERQRMEGQYKFDIARKVQANWIQPENWPTGTACTVRVSQIPGGEVVNVRIVTSCGDEFLNRSVENAVYKASPLPAPPDPSVFARELEFVFRPGG